MSLIAAPAAQAHDSLSETQPAAGDTVTEVPEVSLTSSNTLLDLQGIGTAFVIRVQDDEGLYYGDGCVTLSDATMSMPVELGEEGEYTVTWRAVSTDGHTISDAYTFSYQPTEGTTAADGVTAVPRCGAEARPGDDSDQQDGEVPQGAESQTGLLIGLGVGGVILVGGLIGFVIAARRMKNS
ncbi:copper resistance CopC family protein [Amnibacterium flavum]|nr:copper resistance CopC family protein [Amnibacterium flavum]